MKALTALLLALLLAGPAGAYSTLFDSRCASCHVDDTPTCDGCHQHRGNLGASTDLPGYEPGDPVAVTLEGGRYGGWIRALLYDHNGLLVDSAEGPTGTGDDGLAGAVTFPAFLLGTAPAEPGDYVWEAAWFGSNNSGTAHLEAGVSVTVHVSDGSTSVPGEAMPCGWELIKLLY